MNNKDDIVERLSCSQEKLSILTVNNKCANSVRYLNLAATDCLDAISRIQSDAKRIAELEAELEAAVDRLSNPWVPIDDMPDEWRDGRGVDLIIDGLHYCDCVYSVSFKCPVTGNQSMHWWVPFLADYLRTQPTYAKLPTPLPEPTP